MTTIERRWFRPSLMVFTDSQPTPATASIGTWNIGSVAGTDYIFITDDGRNEIQLDCDRIEYKKRMINGRMRSYHVADKMKFSVSWDRLPSNKSYISEVKNNTAAAWAAGKELLEWYKNHNDSFYLMLVYDTPDPEGTGSIPLKYKIETYNVFFENFSYNIIQRGSLFDTWNLSLSLVEA